MLRITFAMCVLVLLLQAAIGQLPKNRGQKTPTNEGVPAKDREINLERASGSLGQIRRPLPPPSEGWLVIMQRFDFSLNFYRNWREYRNGFGELDLQKEFWLGNEAIHLLTSRVHHKLRIELVTNGALFYADYDSFSVESEDKKYTLHVSGYSGNAGDSMTAKGGAPLNAYHDGFNFSTPDADNDNSTATSCSRDFQGGWWFNSCHWVCLTCQKNHGFYWETLQDLGVSGGLPIGARMRIMRK